jgi:hypothetical protein
MIFQLITFSIQKLPSHSHFTISPLAGIASEEIAAVSL